MLCNYQKLDGKQCQATAMRSSSMCFVHNPETKAQHKAAVLKGGKTSLVRLPVPLPPMDMLGNQAVLILLGDTINRVREGSMDVRIANCLGFLSSKILEAREKISLEEQLHILESKLIEKGLL